MIVSNGSCVSLGRTILWSNDVGQSEVVVGISVYPDDGRRLDCQQRLTVTRDVGNYNITSTVSNRLMMSEDVIGELVEICLMIIIAGNHDCIVIGYINREWRHWDE